MSRCCTARQRHCGRLHHLTDSTDVGRLVRSLQVLIMHTGALQNHSLKLPRAHEERSQSDSALNRCAAQVCGGAETAQRRQF